MKKRLISCCILLGILTTSIVPNYANALSYTPTTTDFIETLDNTSIVKTQYHVMSTEEVIEFYIERKGYSPESAKEFANQLRLDNSRIVTRTITVNATDDLGLTSLIEIGCRVRETYGSGRTNFNEIVDSWTGIVSSGIQKWNEFTHSATVIGATKTSIQFYARGTIDVEISRSNSVGISVNLLESLGYSVEKTTSTTWTVRKVVDLSAIYTLPGYPDP